jgi:hypothetical protein
MDTKLVFVTDNTIIKAISEYTINKSNLVANHVLSA